jgi:hypothetical protein
MQPIDYAEMLAPHIDRLRDFKPKLAARKLIEAAGGQLPPEPIPEEEMPLVYITLRETATQKRAYMTVGAEALDRYLAKIDRAQWEIEDIDRE